MRPFAIADGYKFPATFRTSQEFKDFVERDVSLVTQRMTLTEAIAALGLDDLTSYQTADNNGFPTQVFPTHGVTITLHTTRALWNSQPDWAGGLRSLRRIHPILRITYADGSGVDFSVPVGISLELRTEAGVKLPPPVRHRLDQAR